MTSATSATAERVDPAPRPAVSIVIPGYRSDRTVAGCLAALARQSFRDCEVVLVDSSPDDATERIVRDAFPWVRYEHSDRRLLPHAARNRGVELAHGELLVFSDPDVYAHPDWLARLLTAHGASGEVIVGGLACFGSRWLDQGIHLCKFSKWLPAGPPRRLDMGPTASLLVSRADFLAAAGFPDGQLLGDVTFSRRLATAGKALLLQPDAVVEHHHLHTLGSFLAERYRRGRLFGELRCSWLTGRRGALLGYLLVTALPIRLARIMGLVAIHAARAGQTGRYLATLPITLAGHAASLAGEAVTYAHRLRAAPTAAG
jgi:glycosyltransferase involved in cell wall biosynthesis